MPGFLKKGMLLQQHKEPALSRDLRSLILPGSTQFTGLEKVVDSSLLLPREILEIARLAEITDEHDGLPLYEKLMRAMALGTVVVVADAIDDEPYVSSQLNPLFKLSQQAVGGLLYAAKAVGSQDIEIAVYKNMSDVKLRIPNTLYGVRIKRITGKYPVEVRSVFYERGENSKNVLLIGVCALIHLYRAVHKGVKQTTSFVTVAGNCIGNPMNIEVSCGAKITQVVERCGLIDEPTKIVVGGPMTGVCIADPLRTLIEPTTRAILVFKTDNRDTHYNCIGCGKCTTVCPKNLSPVYLYKASKTKHVRLLRTLDVKDCIGCGTCSYVCPARLDLTAEILMARHMISALDDRASRQQLEERRIKEENERLERIEEEKRESERRMESAKREAELLKAEAIKREQAAAKTPDEEPTEDILKPLEHAAIKDEAAEVLSGIERARQKLLKGMLGERPDKKEKRENPLNISMTFGGSGGNLEDSVNSADLTGIDESVNSATFGGVEAPVWADEQSAAEKQGDKLGGEHSTGDGAPEASEGAKQERPEQ